MAGPDQRAGHRRAGRRTPSLARHQAGAPAIARLPVELRRRLQLHQRVDRHVHRARPGHGLRRAHLLLGVADRHHRARPSSP